MSDNYLSLNGISKQFDGVLAVDNVNLEIKKGEIFALLGGSGCGKSTLLRMLAGFETPSGGDIYLDGEKINDMAPHKRPINMMFQSYALFPHMSVEQNIAFGLKQEGIDKVEVQSRVSEMLRLVDMVQYAKRKPHQLSGGQQQRVALARSLAKHPKLLLLDEPMGALDKKLRTRMQLEVVDIIERVGVTCVMVTHDQEEAMTMASRIAVMDQGYIEQVGEPRDVYEYPKSELVASFIGSVNIFHAKFVDDERDYAEFQCDDLSHPIRVSYAVSGREGLVYPIAIRPEKMRVSKQEPEQNKNRLKGTVLDIAYLGSHAVYHVKLASGKVVLAQYQQIDRHVEDYPTWEDEVFLCWDDNSAVVLNP